MFTTEKLYVGQEFKSIQALSLFISGSKIPPGNQYTNTINKMKQHFSWKTVPHSRRIIITEIFEQPKITIRKSKYTMQFISNLAAIPEDAYTKYELYVLLGITNPKFTLQKYYTSNINNLKYSLRQYNFIHNELDSILSQFFYLMIERLDNLDFITVEKTYKYKFKNETKEIPTDLIDNINNELLKEFGYDNVWSVYHSSNKKEFKEKVKEKLNAYGITNYCRAYKFKFTNMPTNLLAPSLFEMNKLIVNKLKNETDFAKTIDNLIALQ